jgi:hypothetical protein
MSSGCRSGYRVGNNPATAKTRANTGFAGSGCRLQPFSETFLRARARARARVCFNLTLQPATIRRKPAPMLASRGYNLFFKAATMLPPLNLPPPRPEGAGEISIFSVSDCF